jgi:hypothetical protein
MGGIFGDKSAGLTYRFTHLPCFKNAKKTSMPFEVWQMA